LPEIELKALAPFADQARQLLIRAETSSSEDRISEDAEWTEVADASWEKVRAHRAARRHGDPTVTHKNQKKILRMNYNIYQSPPIHAATIPTLTPTCETPADTSTTAKKPEIQYQ